MSLTKDADQNVSLGLGSLVSSVTDFGSSSHAKLSAWKDLAVDMATQGDQFETSCVKEIGQWKGRVTRFIDVDLKKVVPTGKRVFLFCIFFALLFLR